MRGEVEKPEGSGLQPVSSATAFMDSMNEATREAFERARTLWNAMAKDPESESFGGPTFEELRPAVQRFAAITFSCIDPRELSDGIAPPRAPISCRSCRDTGKVHRVRDGTGEALCWFCMDCDKGLRQCAGFWAHRLKRPAGERDYREWMKANPVEARRVAAVKPSNE